MAETGGNKMIPVHFRAHRPRRFFGSRIKLAPLFPVLAACAVLVATAALADALAQEPVNSGTAATSEPLPSNMSLNKSEPSNVGFRIFQQTCLGCHGKPEYPQAPSPTVLRSYTPERIYQALTSGAMKAVGDTLSDTDRALVAQAVAGRLFGNALKQAAKYMPNRCASNPPMRDPAAGPSWNGWGNNIDNARFQPAEAAGLTAAQVPKLKLKWAFGLPNSTSSYSQPTVVSGRVFVGTDTGYIYSMDAKTGCVYWSYAADGYVRNALTIAPVSGHGATKYAAFFGDLKSNVYAVDAQTGTLLWKSHVEPQYTMRITAPPAFYEGKLFVPVSSWEEFSAKSLDYPCCTGVGSIVALDANTGERLWKTYVIAERPHPVRKNSKGVQQFGPAGGSVWNTPAVDPKQNAIYFGTGDATTFPPADTADSVMALDMDTGKMIWHYQVTSGDSYLVGCRDKGITDNCPETEGPDWDIPVSPILTELPDGKRLIVVATKPGDVLAFDPDRKGAVVWRMNVSGRFAGNALPPGVKHLPGMMWGGAICDGNVYYGLTDGDVVAIQLATGKLVWRKSPAPGEKEGWRAAPASAIPGVVFVGGLDGKIFALSTANGDTLWNFDTNRDFDTVDEVAAHGGGLGSQGVSIVGGMVFAGSGYAHNSVHPGNVVLAFAPE